MSCIDTSSDEDSRHSESQQSVPFPTNSDSLQVFLLHGDLEIVIKEARNLPKMNKHRKALRDKFHKLPKRVSKKIEEHMYITRDPYVTVSVSGAVIARTFVKRNSENPVWMQHFNVPVAHQASEVHFVVKDNEVVDSQIIGALGITVEQLLSYNLVEGTFPILGHDGKPCNSGAVLTLSIQYTPIEKKMQRIGSGPDFHGVPGTYFPLRRGGKVTLYQDAHVVDGTLPDLKLDDGAYYHHGKCWLDILNAINQARHLVYITGWSIYHLVNLVRDADDGKDYILGDLLKARSQEGVRVLLLVWDDPTSSRFLRHREGYMHTNDEETRRFFKHSSVEVLLCPRSASKVHSLVKQQESFMTYTHHQKTVIVDADAGQYTRKIIAFVGGLDLCKGRYDTPGHSIFRTLQTVHKDDYHNPNFKGPTAGCPRQPWHDLHCRIDGPAAYDILTNFKQRWLKASERHGLKKLRASHSDDLLEIEEISDILGIDDVPWLSEDDPESWHVQVFRSIDSNSVDFDEDPRNATSMNLVCGKNVLIDMSIQRAYVKAIRSAQDFIYIENQYFLGSSYNWNSYADTGANNLVPMEIALKIANKIRAKERFSAYIVLPMWPEGVPTNLKSAQGILYWQSRTMEMMYQTVYEALEEVGLEKDYEPQDFLNFFCLGNREVVDEDNNADSAILYATDTPQALTRKNRRFMIYVHSKGMIVDDEYVIVGSANINERSMAGTRDTEIAMGAYQPHYTWGNKHSSPLGQVQGYRMSLWAEHIGDLEECFKKPESLECVRRVRAISELNWKQFAAEEVTEMNGHLLKYPVEIDRMGRVNPLPGCNTFLDMGGEILGTYNLWTKNFTI